MRSFTPIDDTAADWSGRVRAIEGVIRGNLVIDAAFLVKGGLRPTPGGPPTYIVGLRVVDPPGRLGHLEVYPCKTIAEARREFLWRVAGGNAGTVDRPLDGSLLIGQAAGAIYDKEYDLLTISVIQDNYVGKLQISPPEVAWKVAEAFAEAVRAIAPVEAELTEKPLYQVSEDAYLAVGTVPVPEECPPTRSPHLRPEELPIQIVDPPDGTWVPVDVTRVTIRGIVRIPGVDSVRMFPSGEVVPVQDGKFEHEIELYTRNTIDVTVESGDPKQLDRIRLCPREGKRGLSDKEAIDQIRRRMQR